VRGDLLRVFERSAVFKIYANARRPEHWTVNFMVFLRKGVGAQRACKIAPELRPNCVWMAAINDCAMN
jgi:hypothetical protein